MDSQLASSKLEESIGSQTSNLPKLRQILIVEDDVSLSKFLHRGLSAKHFDVKVCHDGETGCLELGAADYSLVILDLNLPTMDGIEFLKQIRLGYEQLPVLVLTARNRNEDLLNALEQGADDYLIKPFSFLELLARVRALLRRNSAPSNKFPRVSDLVLIREEHRVMRGDRRIDLTPREFAILEYLMDNVGKPVSRMSLMRDVWNMAYDPTTNIVDVYMKYLRDKVDLEGESKLIRTVRGVGYVISND